MAALEAEKRHASDTLCVDGHHLSDREVLSSGLGSPQSVFSPAESRKGSKQMPTRSQRIERPKPFAREMFQDAQVYVLRCEGVLWGVMDVTDRKSSHSLEKAIVEVVNGMLESGKKVIFVATNQCSRTSCFEKLVDMGIRLSEVDKDSIVSLGRACAWYFRRERVQKPWLLTASRHFLEDVKASFPECLATIDDAGDMVEAYLQDTKISRASVARVTESSRAADVDGVVIGSDPALSSFKLAVACQFAARTRVSRCPHKEEESQDVVKAANCNSDEEREMASSVTTASDAHKHRLEGIPVISVPGLATKKAIHVFERSSSAASVNTSFSKLLEGADVRLPSALFLEMLKGPSDEGGFGIDPSQTIFVASLETDISFANEAGMQSLLVSRDAVAPVVGPTTAFRCRPHWVLPTLADALP
jgi:ribonucleotide monophosphatase NagD (HAD superfamily)